MKQQMKPFQYIALFALFVGLASCGGKTENSLEDANNDAEKPKSEISKEQIFHLIETFPTPVEMAQVIKNGDFDFSSDMLLPADGGSENYSTSYEKGMALGAYGADMGYLNIHNKTFLVPDYLEIVRNLAKDLDLDNFFSFDKMIEMSENVDNVDSLIQLSTNSFNDMEAYLREQGRDEISLMIVFGTWLEGAYVISDIAGSSQDKVMLERVAEQKDFVMELNKIFKSSSDKYFKELSASIDPLEELYSGVEIEFIMREPTMEEVDGMPVFIDNSETIIHAEDGVIDDIIATTEKLRNKLLK